jgi:hypothetical protein
VRYSKILSIACLPIALSVAACSSDDKANTTSGTGGCMTFNYSNYMAGTAPLTLAANVMPIFTASCSLGVPCHTDGSHPPNLGGMTATAMSISAAIVDVNSTEVPTMKYVAKGSPQNSWLMRKLEDANPGCGLSCTNPTGFPAGCASQMPSGGPPFLSTGDQTTIRDWIAQGAK